MPEVKIQFAKRVGSSHLKLRIGDGVGRIGGLASALARLIPNWDMPWKTTADGWSMSQDGWTSTHGKAANPFSCASKTPPLRVNKKIR
jgi:hypothetical protein